MFTWNVIFKGIFGTIYDDLRELFVYAVEIPCLLTLQVSNISGAWIAFKVMKRKGWIDSEFDFNSKKVGLKLKRGWFKELTSITVKLVKWKRFHSNEPMPFISYKNVFDMMAAGKPIDHSELESTINSEYGQELIKSSPLKRIMLKQ